MNKTVQIEMNNEEVLEALKQYCEREGYIRKDETKLDDYHFGDETRSDFDFETVNLFYKDVEE